MTELLVATHNRGKIEEFRRILGGLGVALVGAGDLNLPEVDEDGETFEANAIKKARALAAAARRITLADDSGLEVDALGGAPGVRSARYAGGAGPEANIRKLLAALEGVPPERRTARFRCVLALADPEGPLGERVELAAAACEGTIALAPRGSGGFGYDPIFIPAGEVRTMAELAAAEKDALSHRGRACRALAPWLATYLTQRAAGR
jgi:XTP/dITP diphosphohydrolase